MHSSFSDAKKVSATALSQHWRGRERDWIILWSVSRFVNSLEVYWLAAAVGVEHRTRRGSTVLDGHPERVADQLGAHVVGHRPAHNAS
jgi:hypothetical protein